MSAEEKKPLSGKINSLKMEVKNKIKEISSQDIDARNGFYKDFSGDDFSWDDIENEVFECGPEDELKLLILIDKGIDQLNLEFKSGSMGSWVVSVISPCLPFCLFGESPCFVVNEEKQVQMIEGKLEYLQGLFDNKIEEGCPLCNV